MATGERARAAPTDDATDAAAVDRCIEEPFKGDFAARFCNSLRLLPYYSERDEVTMTSSIHRTSTPSDIAGPLRVLILRCALKKASALLSRVEINLSSQLRRGAAAPVPPSFLRVS